MGNPISALCNWNLGLGNALVNISTVILDVGQCIIVKSGSSLGQSPDEFWIKGMRTEGQRLA